MIEPPRNHDVRRAVIDLLGEALDKGHARAHDKERALGDDFDLGATYDSNVLRHAADWISDLRKAVKEHRGSDD